MTIEEKRLWQKLRGRKFHGLKFFHQHPIVYEQINGKPLFFIPDFYCSEKKIVIEIDGKIHEFRKKYDNRREEILSNMELQIIRFKNEELNNMVNVLKCLEVFIYR